MPARVQCPLDSTRIRQVVSPAPNAPVAQLDRVLPSEEVKQGFETGGKDWEIRDFQKAIYLHVERSDQGVTKRRTAGQKGYCYNLDMRP